MCLSKHKSGDKLNYLKNPLRDSKILFVQESYESLAMLDGKTKQGPFSMIQYCKITVWPGSSGQKSRARCIFLCQNDPYKTTNYSGKQAKGAKILL